MSFSFPAHLYPIIDPLGDPARSHIDLARAIIDGGAPLVQLRVKDQPTGRFVEIARAVKSECDRHRARLIINDRIDIAQLVDAAGVHVGQQDLPPAAARQILGVDKIIGYSTHTREQAEAAARGGIADYIGFGPIYPTSSKAQPNPVQGLEGLRQVRRHVALPIVAIGGVTAATIAEVLAVGADAVAMISEVTRAPDVTATVRTLLSLASRVPRRTSW